MTEKEKSSKSASSEMDKLLDELETLVNADKTPKPFGFPFVISPSYFGWTFLFPMLFHIKPE